MTIIVNGLLDGRLVARGLRPSDVAPSAPVTSYPDPFAARIVPPVDPFAATSTPPVDPFAATVRYKGS